MQDLTPGRWDQVLHCRATRAASSATKEEGAFVWPIRRGDAIRAPLGPGSAVRRRDVRTFRRRDRAAGFLTSAVVTTQAKAASGLRRAGRDPDTLRRSKTGHRQAPLSGWTRDAHLLVSGPTRARHRANALGRPSAQARRARQSRRQPGTAAALTRLRRRHLVLLRPQVRRAADEVVEPLAAGVPPRPPSGVAVPASP